MGSMTMTLPAKKPAWQGQVPWQKEAEWGGEGPLHGEAEGE